MSLISKIYFLKNDIHNQEMYLRWWLSSIGLAGLGISDPVAIENDADDFRGRGHENKNSFCLSMSDPLLRIGIIKRESDDESGTPYTTRTCDPKIRNLVL